MLNRILVIVVFGLLATQLSAVDLRVINVRLCSGPDDANPEIDIRIREGLIVEMGADVAPNKYVPIDGAGGCLTPGLIDSGSTIGLQEVGLSTNAEDQKYDGDEISASFNPGLAFNKSSSLLPVSLSEGIVAAALKPEAGKDVFAGQMGLVSLIDGKVSEPSAVLVYLGEEGRGMAGNSRAAALQKLLTALDDARLYDQKRRAYEKNQLKSLSLPESDLEVLAEVVRREKKLVLYIDRAAEIEAVLAALDDYDLDIVLMGAREAWKVTGALISREIPVVLEVLDNKPSNFDRLGARLNNARLLASSGITVAIMSEYLYQESRMLTQSAGVAVAYGMRWDRALDAITVNPAKIWGFEHQVGPIEVGRPATFIIWSGDPFELTSRVLHVVKDGRFVDIQTRQDMLRDRYREIEGGDKPFSYRWQP